MKLSEIGLLLFAICFGATGQLFLKLGALQLGKVTFSSMGDHLLRLVTIPELFLGLVAYGIGAVAYILLLTRVNLSVAGPASALGYAITVLLGYFVFHETLSLLRLFAMFLIVCGVVLITVNP